MFDNAAIATRHLIAPLDWYEQPHGWGERNQRYLAACEDMFERAALAAIEQAGLDPSEIDGVVTVSTTGIATPSLDARVGPRIGLRSDVRRPGVWTRLRGRGQPDRPFPARAWSAAAPTVPHAPKSLGGGRRNRGCP